MKGIIKALPSLIIILLAFYLLPLLIKDTGSAMAILLVIIPIICLVCSLLYTLRNPFKWWYPVAVAIIFIPSLFIFYNMSAWIYIIGYGVISLSGNLVGYAFSKTISTKK